MNQLKEQVLRIAQQQPQQRPKQEPGDYMKDGLLYCGVCHTPLEHRYTFEDGSTIIHSCLCQHMLEMVRRRRMEQEREAEIQRIKQLKLESIQDKAMLNATFANDDGQNPKMNIAKRYVAKWEQMQKENIGLLLYGDVGSGKTYFAGCIANALLDNKQTVLMTNFTRLVNQLSEFGSNKNAILKDLNRYDLLIIDDLGVERQSGFVLEQVYSIINSRYTAGLPLIITTNIPIGDILNPKDMNYKRIYDRIVENCVPIEFTGCSRRQQANKEKIKKAKELLF